MLKTKSSTELLFSFEDCKSALQNSLKSKEEYFALQEYLIPESDSVKVIRIYFTGLQVNASVFENIWKFNENTEGNQKFLLGECENSERLVLSSSMVSLRKKVTSLHYLVSSKLKLSHRATKNSFDFIKQGGLFYLISAHCYKNAFTLSDSRLHTQTSTSHRLFTAKDSKQVLLSPISHRSRLILPEPYTTQRLLEDRVNTLINKKEIPALKYVSYQKWAKSEDDKDILCRLYSQKILSTKEKFKNSHIQGLSTLKSLSNNMSDMEKKFKIEYNLTDYLMNEAGLLLIKKAQESQKERKLLEQKLSLITKPKPKSKLDYAADQLDRIKASLSNTKRNIKIHSDS